jgi:quercetin dioxygenase-like cupin family protein
MATMVRHGDVQLLETPGRNQTGGLATPSRGAGEVSVIRQRQMPGGANPLHTHDREEVMLVTGGTVAVTVADERFDLGQGDTLIVPARTPHRIENAGAEAAEWLLVAPAGVRFFGADGTEGSPPWAR